LVFKRKEKNQINKSLMEKEKRRGEKRGKTKSSIEKITRKLVPPMND